MNSRARQVTHPGLCVLLALAALLGPAAVVSTAEADDLLGADGVIALIARAADPASEKKADSVSGKQEARRLLDDLENFKAVRDKLPAEEAVERWLQFYGRFRMLPPGILKNQYGPPSADDLSMSSLLSALPPPTAWEVLKARVLARQKTDGGAQEKMMGALACFLTQDQANLEKALEELKTGAALGGNTTSSNFFRQLGFQGRRQEAGRGSAAIPETFAAYLQSLKSERPQGHLTVQVPDLVALAGEERARQLMLEAIAIPGLSLNIPSGGRTLELAKRLVLDNVDRLTEPQWELVTSHDDVALYEAMDKRFPDKTKSRQAPPDMFQEVDKYEYRSLMDDSARLTAKITYIMGLIARNRVKDATEQAKQMDSENLRSKDFIKSWHSFDKKRFAAGLNQFCKDLLTDRPELPLWKECGILFADDGSQELIAIIAAAANKPNLGLEARLGIRERHVDLLLAMDRVEDAVSLIRETLKVGDDPATPQARLAVARGKLGMAPRLCTLGTLLARPEWTREGEEAFLSILKDAGSLGESLGQSLGDVRNATAPAGAMIDALLDNGKFAQAEKIVLAAIQATLNTPQLTATSEARTMALTSGVLASHLVRLAEIYERAGRHEDVVTLLEQTPWWGGADLIDLADQHNVLPPLAARALHLRGRDGEAIEIVKSHLLGNPGDDAAYLTLTEILGSAAIPWLDELQARDRFEERPLIWKAQLLGKAGKLAEAEATVRQALQIDPTDGEQKGGDRGRAYAVLAEILKAGGKTDDAAFFEGVVASIRIAAQGDKLTAAGLIRKSLAMYEEAALSFADAYCVQWRLAERLSALGDIEAARKHYEIAFERMPEQFGQVARFCFGCEGVFTHQQSVSVAEQVLTGLAKTAPQKPQVQYLLGQLREAQGRKADAYRHFRMAVELDPQYLDALKAAFALRKDVFLSQEEADEIALRMVRLDPLRRHNDLDAGEISDLRGLWSIYKELETARIKVPKSLFALTASKQAMEAFLKKTGSGGDFLDWKQRYYVEQRLIPEPGDAVVKNRFVQSLLQVNFQGGRMVE